MVSTIAEDPEILEVFFAYLDKYNPPIDEQLYLFMKRFHTQPGEFFSMDRRLRLNLYKREFSLLEEEYNRAKASEEST